MDDAPVDWLLEGWGARLLAKQGRGGRWSGFYTPKWTSATYTLMVLRDCGLPPNKRVRDACSSLIDAGIQPDGGVNFGTWANWTKRGGDDRGERCEARSRADESFCLRGLDYFRSVNAARDERLTDAIDLLLEKRMPDGRWPLQHRYSGKTYFEMERPRKPSRWSTPRALRVLDW
jgi:hypothetical protein